MPNQPLIEAAPILVDHIISVLASQRLAQEVEIIRSNTRALSQVAQFSADHALQFDSKLYKGNATLSCAPKPKLIVFSAPDFVDMVEGLLSGPLSIAIGASFQSLLQMIIDFSLLSLFPLPLFSRISSAVVQVSRSSQFTPFVIFSLSSSLPLLTTFFPLQIFVHPISGGSCSFHPQARHRSSQSCSSSVL